MTVDVHENGSLGGQNVLPQKVEQGLIQAGQQSMQNLTPYAASYNVLDFPFLFPSNEIFEKFLDDPEFLESELGSQPQRKGLKVLPGMWSNTGYRVFCLRKKIESECRVPSDLKGLKVRVTASKVELQTFAMTPASPVSVDWAETYLAMQEGVVDAVHVGLGPLTAIRIPDTVGSVTRLKMSLNPHITVVNKRWYEGLPDNVQGAIQRAARESMAFQREGQRKANEQMWSEWKAAGIKVVDPTPEEHSVWMAAVGHQKPEWSDAKKRYGEALYERIISFVKKQV